MNENERINEYFHNLTDDLLMAYFSHIRHNSLDVKRVSENISYMTNVEYYSIERTLEENLIREAARRWYYNYISEIETKGENV